jgi:hypothetical protein
MPFNISEYFSVMSDTVVDEKGLLKAFPIFKVRQLRRLRREGKIPHMRVSERLVLYDTNRVMEALRKLEVTG